MFKKLFSLLLVFTLCIGVLPQLEFNSNYFNLQANLNEPDKTEDSGKQHSNNTNVWNDAFPDVDFYDISTGSQDLLGRGVYTGEDDSYFYIYDLAKRTQADTYYSTLAFTVTTKQLDINSTDVNNNPYRAAAILTPKGKALIQDFGTTRLKNIVNYNNASLESVSTGRGQFVNVTTTSKDGYTSVATLLKFPKAKLMTLVENQGMVNSLAWKMGSDANGSSVMKANLYLQGVTGVTVNGQLGNNIYTFYPDLARKMSNWTAASQADVKRYYNIPMYVKKPQNSITYIDVKTGKVLYYQNISKDTDSQHDLTNFTYVKVGDLTFPSSDIRYEMVAGAMLPKGYFTESSKYSAYLENVIKPNQQSGKTGIDQFTCTGEEYQGVQKVVNNFLSTVNANPVWGVANSQEYEGSSLINTSNGKLTSTDVTPALMVADKDPKVLVWVSALSMRNPEELTQVSSFSGYQLYCFVQPKTSLDSEVDYLYYDSKTKDLIYREKKEANTTATAQTSVKYNNKTYTTEQVSYKVDRDPEVDITATKGQSTVMTADDIAVTSGNTLTIPEEIINDKTKTHIIRVQCNIAELEETNDDAEYTIPAQSLGKLFNYNRTLEAHVIPAPIPAPTTHEYTKDGCKCKSYQGTGDNAGHTEYYCGGHECTVSYSHSYDTHTFDWSGNLKSIIAPISSCFTDIGGLTNFKGMSSGSITKTEKEVPVLDDDGNPVLDKNGNPKYETVTETKYENGLTSSNNILASGGHDISTTMSLDFFSHRVDIDGVAPVFAEYMNKQNAPVLKFMKEHSMTSLATEALVPNTKYSDKGGKKVSTIAATKGSETKHGQPYTETKSHSGCGEESVTTEKFISTSTYTNTPAKITVNAEPSIVGSTLPIGSSVSKTFQSTDKFKNTYLQTMNGHIGFYPTYKMFLSSYDAWVLGKVQRQMKPVNVATIESLTTDTPVLKVSSTWSRDKEDTGSLTMKAGYNYSLTSAKPAEFKITTYTVVPKEGWVKDSATVRKTLLKEHENLINTFCQADSFKIISNLPEAFADSADSQYKVTNPHKKASDNVTKSRLNNIHFNLSKGSTQSSVLSLEAADTALGTDNAKRLADQLQTKDWYVEKFSGFEVVKQVTTIKVSIDKFTATNFVRNGGTVKNDLAKAVANIPAGIYGFEIALDKEAKFFDQSIRAVALTKPYTFSVRGSVYDDRD